MLTVIRLIRFDRKNAELVYVDTQIPLTVFIASLAEYICKLNKLLDLTTHKLKNKLLDLIRFVVSIAVILIVLCKYVRHSSSFTHTHTHSRTLHL